MVCVSFPGRSLAVRAGLTKGLSRNPAVVGVCSRHLCDGSVAATVCQFCFPTPWFRLKSNIANRALPPAALLLLQQKNLRRFPAQGGFHLQHRLVIAGTDDGRRGFKFIGDDVSAGRVLVVMRAVSAPATLNSSLFGATRILRNSGGKSTSIRTVFWLACEISNGSAR